MVFGFGEKSKSYEMPRGANVTPGILSKDAFAGLASDLESHVGYIDVTLVLRGEPYTLHHSKGDKLRYSFWSVEVTGKSGEDMDNILQALMGTIGKKREKSNP